VSVDASAWTKIGSTANAEFYEIEPQILAVVPAEGCVDNAETAKASVYTQLAHLRSRGRRAGVIVFMDRILEQDAEARAVYRDLPDPAYQACFALVGGTAFGRAVGSLFIGLSPPRVPTRLFPDLADAIAWVRARLVSQ